MTIITDEGKLVEGQELTAEEVSIMNDLIDGDIFYGRVGEYVSKHAREKIAAALFAEFILVRRSPKPVVEAPPEVESFPEILPGPVVEESSELEPL